MEIFIKNKQVVTTDMNLGGGINLLQDTLNMASFSNEGNTQNLETSSKEQVKYLLNANMLKTRLAHLWGPSAMKTFLQYSKDIYLNKGTYTLSFIARNNGHAGEQNEIGLYCTYTDSHGGKPFGITKIGNNLGFHQITFNIPESTTYSELRLGEFSDNSLPGGSLYYGNLKLECGCVATPYSPAPEDIWNEIEILKSKMGG